MTPAVQGLLNALDAAQEPDWLLLRVLADAWDDALEPERAACMRWAARRGKWPSLLDISDEIPQLKHIADWWAPSARERPKSARLPRPLNRVIQPGRYLGHDAVSKSFVSLADAWSNLRQQGINPLTGQRESVGV